MGLAVAADMTCGECTRTLGAPHTTQALTMKLPALFLSRALTALALSALAVCAHAAGFQRGLAADPDGKPLQLGIWYPSLAAAVPLSLGTTTMAVALNGAVQGQALPLLVMSHGTGSSYLGHAATAVALADAGYVVVAVTHTGDNYADPSRSVFVMDRPRHVSRAIDHMLQAWDGRAAIDATRIGIFGYSSGGFTALVSIGGMADFTSFGPMCQQHPGDFACQLVARAGPLPPSLPDPRPAQDPRIKAAVVVAPALGFTFSPSGLKDVKVPVQIWRAEDDIILPHPRYAEAVQTALLQRPSAPNLQTALDYRVVPRAGHFDFMPPCSKALAEIAPAICTSAAGFDRAAFQQNFNAAVIEFFGNTLTAGSVQTLKNDVNASRLRTLPVP